MFLKLKLQMFGEGGAEGAAAQASGNEGTQAVNQLATGQSSENPLASVKYGIQDGQGESDTSKGAIAPEVNVDKKAAFEQMIKGEFKDEYNSRMQEAISKRFKTHEAVENRQKALAPVLEMLGKKYGIDTSDVNTMDIEKLSKAIMDDDSYYEAEAMERGISVEMLKQIKNMETENKQMKEAMQKRQEQDQNREAYAELMQQCEEVKKIYPGFDIRVEMNNPKFGRLVAGGVDAKTAYEVVHMDEIRPAMAQHIVNKTKEMISNDIQSGAKRVSENGANSQGAVTTKTDVNKLTKEDRDEITRRVMMGEKIRF